MKCRICGYSFDENKTDKTCKACPLCNCNRVRCPKCGSELSPESKDGTKFKSNLKKLFSINW